MKCLLEVQAQPDGRYVATLTDHLERWQIRIPNVVSPKAAAGRAVQLAGLNDELWQEITAQVPSTEPHLPECDHTDLGQDPGTVPGSS